MTEKATKPGARKDTYRWIAAGLASGIALNVLAWMYWPRLDALDQPIDRLLLALQCCAGVGFVALVMLQGLWRLPDTPGAEDPFANAESRGPGKCSPPPGPPSGSWPSRSSWWVCS